MSDTTILKQMLRSDNLLSLEDHYGKKKLILEEAQANDSRVEVRNVPDDSIVIDLDTAFQNQGLFRGSQGECKRADYLLISETEGIVLFIELKQGQPKPADVVKQLRGSLCVLEYCQSIAREFFQQAAFLAHYQHRFILLKRTGSHIGRTAVPRDTPKHDSPNQPMIITGKRPIQFNQIAN